MQKSCCRYVAMVTETLSRIASKYSSAVLFLCRVEKSMIKFSGSQNEVELILSRAGTFKTPHNIEEITIFYYLKHSKYR